MKSVKRLSFILLSAVLLCGCTNQNTKQVNNSAQPIPVTTVPAGTAQEGDQQTEETSVCTEILASMTLEEKVWQLFMVTPEQLTGVDCATIAGIRTESALRNFPVGGIIYFAQNLEDVEQTRSLLSGTQNFSKEISGIGLFLAVDEEGGTVARAAKSLGTTKFEDMAHYGAKNDAQEAYGIGKTIGTDIGSLGFNVDFAPVADVDLCDGNELGDRIFSDDPQIVANMVSAVVKGLQETGVSATLKHFPGLGAEDGNSHDDDKVIIDRTPEQLKNAEFVPFSAGIDAGADFVMVGHQIMTFDESGLPSDLSRTIVTDYLRGELGFDGIAVTDSHVMNTISGTYSSAEAAILALEAGMDMILMPQSVSEAVAGVCSAVESGRLTESRIDESVTRILREKEEKGLLVQGKEADTNE